MVIFSFATDSFFFSVCSIPYLSFAFLSAEKSSSCLYRFNPAAHHHLRDSSLHVRVLVAGGGERTGTLGFAVTS
ncbi:unnamed protein product [Linum tenue]|uniref:Secreted protein n=1 Tax=Linum tenue TaxID=586396 RepID=A0AAV0J1R2_9ROSI|nr:unnamed protein product [Linum tenue]